MLREAPRLSIREQIETPDQETLRAVVSYRFQIFKRYFKEVTLVDLVSIDTEGSEYDILSTVDFDRWSFRVMTVEHNHEPQRDQVVALLTSKGYRRVFEAVSRFDDWYVLDA